MLHDAMIEARRKYMRLLKDTEDTSAELRAIASESFVEGWLQCELAMKEIPDAQPK